MRLSLLVHLAIASTLAVTFLAVLVIGIWSGDVRWLLLGWVFGPPAIIAWVSYAIRMAEE